MLDLLSRVPQDSWPTVRGKKWEDVSGKNRIAKQWFEDFSPNLSLEFGLNFGQILNHWLTATNPGQEQLVKALETIKKDPASWKLPSISPYISSKPLEAWRYLYAKDSVELSLARFNKIGKILGFPIGSSKMKTLNAAWSKFLKFHVKIDIQDGEDFCYVKMDRIFQIITEIILNKGQEIPNNKLLFRATWDKRNLNWGNMLFVLIPLHPCFKSQHWKHAITVLMCNGSESEETYNSRAMYWKNLLAQINSGLKVNVHSQDYEIEVVAVPDLKALFSIHDRNYGKEQISQFVQMVWNEFEFVA